MAKLTASTAAAEIACVLGSGILRLSVIVPAFGLPGGPVRAGPWTLRPCIGVVGDRGGVGRLGLVLASRAFCASLSDLSADTLSLRHWGDSAGSRLAV